MYNEYQDEDISEDEALQIALALSASVGECGPDFFPDEQIAEGTGENIREELFEIVPPNSEISVEEAEPQTTIQDNWVNLTSTFIQAARGIGELHSSLIQTKEIPTLEPSMWPKNLSPAQKNALLMTRQQLFMYFCGKGAKECQFSDRFTGRQLACAFGCLRLPVKCEEITSIIQLFKKDSPPISSLAILYRRVMIENAMARSIESGKGIKSTSDVVGDSFLCKLAFTISAPVEWERTINWLEFCHVFDQLQLHVTKAGKVW